MMEIQFAIVAYLWITARHQEKLDVCGQRISELAKIYFELYDKAYGRGIQAGKIEMLALVAGAID